MFSIKDKILCNERATPALSVLNMKIKSNTSSTLINKHRITTLKTILQSNHIDLKIYTNPIYDILKT